VHPLICKFYLGNGWAKIRHDEGGVVSGCRGAEADRVLEHGEQVGGVIGCYWNWLGKRIENVRASDFGLVRIGG